MFRIFLSDKGAKRAFNSLTDEELVIRFKENSDHTVLAELFNRYIHLVYAVCMKYLKDDGKARDHAMLVFESLSDKLSKFEVIHLKSWLLTVTRNTCLMELRRKKREFMVDPSDFLMVSRVENQEELHQRDTKLIDQLVINSLHGLKECQRICLELMYFQDKSYKEIAEITGYTIKEVKSYIQNGKRNIKGLLQSEYEKGE